MENNKYLQEKFGLKNEQELLEKLKDPSFQTLLLTKYGIKCEVNGEIISLKRIRKKGCNKP